MAIPKIIHYCWLSNDPVPADYQKCVASWHEKLPEYEYILWDTKRFDVNALTWTRQAFDVGLYAFAADYIRLYAVYHHGGIYLDMDMEVVKPFGELLETPLLLAYENHVSENIEAGCFGAEAGHQYLRKCMEYFETRDFFPEECLEEIKKMTKAQKFGAINPLVLPDVMKNIMEKHFQNENFTIYNRHYFTAKNVVTGKIEKKRETRTIHHFATNYHTEEWRKEREREQRLHRILGTGLAWKMFDRLQGTVNRFKCRGLGKSLGYYFRRFILRKPATPLDDI